MSDNHAPDNGDQFPDQTLTDAAEEADRALALQPVARVVPFRSSAAVTPLPTPLSSFVGQEAPLARVISLLADPAVRLLTLTGPGGIGKTRLALAAASTAQAYFADGAAFVALESVRQAEQFAPAVAQALGLREQPHQRRREQLRMYLRDKQLLLVLDTFEQILAAGPELTALLAVASEVTALVTSRAPLRVSGEHELPVRPLTLPTEQATATDVLASAAGRLFVERTHEHDPALVLDDQTAALVAGICARLDGLPLAIELAAARAKVLPPRLLYDRLERRLPLLTSGAHDAPARHSTMRHTIAWSYDLLPSAEQRLYRHLSIFLGGFSLEAAEFIAAGLDDAPGSPALTATEHLVDQSLLLSEDGKDGAPRLRILETVREFGLERLADAGEEARARSRHASYFLTLVRTLRPLACLRVRHAPFDRLVTELPNLRLALSGLEMNGPATDFVEMVADLCLSIYCYGFYREGRRWLARALPKIDQAAEPVRGRLRLGYAGVLFGQGEMLAAEPALEQALSLLRHANSPLDLATALILRGAMRISAGDYEAAEQPLREALSLAGQLDDPLPRAGIAGRALANAMGAARGQADLAQAAAHGETALRHYAGMHLDLAESVVLMNLAATAHDAGNLDLAATRWREGIALMGEHGDQRIVADAFTGIARVAATRGAARTALLLFGAADAIRERVGTAMLWPADQEAAHRNLAMLRSSLGEPAVNATLAEGRRLPLPEAFAVAERLDDIAGPPLSRREVEVLELLAAHQTDQEIAEALFISRRTVNWHVGRILAKLDATSRGEAVGHARAAGLI